MAIQEPNGPMPRALPTEESDSGAQVPVFHKHDPSLPGSMSRLTPTAAAAAQAVNADSTATAGNGIASPTHGATPEFPNAGQASTVPESTTTTQEIPMNETIDDASQVTDKALKAAKDKAKATAAHLRILNLFGIGLGATVVVGACAMTINSAMAAEAAAAAAVGATVAPEAVASIGTTIAGYFGSAKAAMSAPTVLAGVTLPLWGWIAAGVAVVGVSYYAYKSMTKSDTKKDEAKTPAQEAGVTMAKALREVGDGFSKGAVNTAALCGMILIVGTLGANAIAASTVKFGVTYGPIVAIGGTFVVVNGAFSILNSWSDKLKAKKAQAAPKPAEVTPTAAAAA